MCIQGTGNHEAPTNAERKGPRNPFARFKDRETEAMRGCQSHAKWHAEQGLVPRCPNSWSLSPALKV